MFNFKKITAVAAIVASAAVAPVAASAQIFKGETAGVGDPVHTMFVTFANQAGKAGVEIQVNAGQTLTKSMLKGGRQEIDFFSTVPAMKQAKTMMRFASAGVKAMRHLPTTRST